MTSLLLRANGLSELWYIKLGEGQVPFVTVLGWNYPHVLPFWTDGKQFLLSQGGKLLLLIHQVKVTVQVFWKYFDTTTNNFSHNADFGSWHFLFDAPRKNASPNFRLKLHAVESSLSHYFTKSYDKLTIWRKSWVFLCVCYN